jgi:putative ABC transport system substrate-binding protein
MRRRDFIQSIVGSATAWPLTARAQQKPVIGFLNSGSADAYPDRITAFQQGLRQLGYVDGENVIDRWALGQYDRLPAFAAELVERRVSVLVATGGEPAALAAKSATSTIPIVFAIGGDPIKLGLVASYNRPGGNATGANILAAEMDGRRLGLLHELMPSATRVGVLLNPNFPPYTEQLNDVQHAARMTNLEVEILRANTDGEIETAFESSSQKRLEALVLAASPLARL